MRIFLANGSIRYNCTIIDLYDRSVIASVTDKWITSNLAIKTLEKFKKLGTYQRTQLVYFYLVGRQYVF